MRVSASEGVATHTVPESCVSGREARGEALTGVRAGRPLSRESSIPGAPTLLGERKATRPGATARVPGRPGVVRDPGMSVRSSFGNREIFRPTSRRAGLARIGKAMSRSR